MKFFIVVIFAAICGTVLCGKAEWEEAVKACTEKLNIKGEDMRDVIHGKVKEADVTPEMKCYFLCLAEKRNMMKDGAFQPQNVAEALSSYFDADQVAKISSECNVKGSDDCDTAYKIISCFAKHKTQKA